MFLDRRDRGDTEIVEGEYAASAEAREELRRRPTIRIATFNTYLLPSAFVTEANKTCTEQSTRAARIGTWLREQRVDIACCQEVWGGGQPALERAILAQDTGDDAADAAPVVGRDKSKNKAVSAASMAAKERYAVLNWCRSWGLAAVDAMWQFATSRGGLWLAHRSGSPVAPVGDVLGTRWHTYSKSMTKSRKGAVAVAYRVYASDGQPSILVVVNTHLDPENKDGIIEFQFQELLEFLRTAVLGGRGLLFTDDGAESLCRPMPSGGLDCALVMCGDFNADFDGDLGKRLLASAKTAGSAPTSIRDLHGEFVKANAGMFSSGTCPPTYDSGANALVMWQQRERIDAVLAFDTLFGAPLRKLRAESAQVHTSSPPMSDHWAVTVDVALQ